MMIKTVMVMVMVMVAALGILMTPTAAKAQHQHEEPVVTVIDGNEHPELIPDTIAYYKFFRLHSVPAGASDEAQRQQNYNIRGLRLDTQDELQLRLELANYRSKFDHFNAAYTKQAERGLVGADVFWAGVKNIVSESRGNLGKNLSPAGRAKFEEAVQQVKRHTRYFTTGGAL